MKKISLLLAGLSLAAYTLAEVPVYKDQQLLLNETVVVGDNGTAYYGDVRLTANADGSFSLTRAERRNLASVDTVDVVVDEAFPTTVSVEVTGELSVSCVDLEQPAVIRDGVVFSVVLAETKQDPLALCALALAAYEVSVPLDVRGLEAGQYAVTVNGHETGFTLTTDAF